MIAVQSEQITSKKLLSFLPAGMGAVIDDLVCFKF